MFDSDDPLDSLLIMTLWLVGLAHVFLALSIFSRFFPRNLIPIMCGLAGITVVFFASLAIYFWKKEYDRIKNTDFERVKRYLTTYIQKQYAPDQNDVFVLVEEEKGLTRKEILKRCFHTYQLNISVFVPNGELLCKVKVSKKEIWIKDIKQISNVNFAKEFYKR
ncbi:hypothetical protein [Bacillus sp. NPDC094106]|uniref:hypothetical protein n=1 Tax=Bacillus sp. NPDC094106 TaxID=3363949 RepID=UPI003803EBE9